MTSDSRLYSILDLSWTLGLSSWDSPPEPFFDAFRRYHIPCRRHDSRMSLEAAIVFVINDIRCTTTQRVKVKVQPYLRSLRL